MLYADTRGDIDGGGRDGLLGSGFMGVVFSAGWTPCIGPALGTILTVAATSGASTGDILGGMLLLAAYSIGLGIPFIITAALLDSARGLLQKLSRHMRKIELVSGSLLVLIGVLVASGQLQSLSQTFSRGEFADFTFRVEECGIGFLDGNLGLSHVGDCLAGALLPVALNQSASGQFAPGQATQQYVFHSNKGDVIDIEVRSINEAVPDFELILYGPDDTLLADATQADSARAEDKLYPLVAFELQQTGLHRISLRNDQVDDLTRFRIKARQSEPIESTEDLFSSASNFLSNLAEIVSDLPPAVGLNVGNRAPEFALTTLDGEAVSLESLRGRIALLNFWGTWCGPCRREMPEFQKIYDVWSERGFEIVAVAYNDSEAAMRDFRDEFSLSFALALDASGAVNEAYAIQTRPSSYLLDADGVILNKHFGIMTEAQLEMELAEAMVEA